MVVVGVDPHKKNHTAVAVDDNGRQLATKTVEANEQGHLALLKWATALAGDQIGALVWGVEDGRHVATRLLRHLVAAGQDVRPVPPHLMAYQRHSERSRGKSDPIDARSVARVVLREPGLPGVRLDQPTRDLRLLVDHREMLVNQRTANINRVRWDLVILQPALEPGSRRLVTQRVLRDLIARLENPATQAGFDPSDAVLAELTADLLHRILADTIVINDLTRRIEDLTTPMATELLAIPGVGALTAAKLLGEVAGIDRFTRSAQLARISGIACIPVWTGNHEKHPLDRGGNRQINAAVHRVAITQTRCHPPATALIHRRRTQHHDTKRGALRVLKRHLVDVIYHAMKTDADRLRTTTPAPTLDAA